MGALTVWVVLTLCSTFSGESREEYKVFETYQEAVAYATPNPENIVVTCVSEVFEANLKKPELPEPEQQLNPDEPQG